MKVMPAKLASGATLLALAALLSGCSMMASPAPTGLAPGLTARMDQPGAVLDRQQALALINSYRSTRGVPPLSPDTGLDGTAQALATQYAQTGQAPSTPQGLKVMKLSAGYATFADTFSGWRNSAADAAALATTANRAGIAMAFNAGSSYGIHWVLVLAD